MFKTFDLCAAIAIQWCLHVAIRGYYVSYIRLYKVGNLLL